MKSFNTSFTLKEKTKVIHFSEIRQLTRVCPLELLKKVKVFNDVQLLKQKKVTSM